MDIRTYWEDKVQKNPEKIFLYYEDEEVSYREFDARINQAANGFLEKGIKKGDKVCLWLPNIPQFLYSWLGLSKIGGVMVPINTRFRAKEAQYVVNHSEAVGMVVHQSFLQIVLEIWKDCPHLKWIVGVDGGELPEGIISYDQLTGGMPKELDYAYPEEDDLAAIIYTSGTTGFPKGAMHVHKNLVITGETFLLRGDVGPDDRIMAILPLFHLNALFYSTWGTIAAGASLILIRSFSASKFWDQAVRYGATEFNFPSAVGKILCLRPEAEFRPEHKIRVAVGIAVIPDVYETFTRRFKIPHVIDAYGLTELPSVCQNPVGGLIKTKSIGLPARHPGDLSTDFTEMKVVDDEGREVAPGVQGELIARNAVMMKGYFKEPEKTAEAIRDGWFYTGDYVYKDDDGYYFFISRKKEILRKGGENISAVEVEDTINQNEKVLESAVIAVPSELGEDEVMACIVLKRGKSMSPEEVIDWYNGRLADFKVPRFIQFRKDLPKTATEKTMKDVLKGEKNLMDTAHDMKVYKKSLGL